MNLSRPFFKNRTQLSIEQNREFIFYQNYHKISQERLKFHFQEKN